LQATNKKTTDINRVTTISIDTSGIYTSIFPEMPYLPVILVNMVNMVNKAKGVIALIPEIPEMLIPC
jgi:hypothetical protein